MFRTVPLSIIRSFSLYTQQCYMSFRFADSLRAGLGNQLDALISQIYFGGKLYMFRTVPLSIIRSFSLYTQQWYMSYRFADSLRAGSGNQLDAIISQIYFGKKLYMFRTVPRSIIRSFSLYTRQCYMPYRFAVYSETPDDGPRNCSKHVEFPSKINLRNQCIQLVYYKGTVTMHGHMNIKLKGVSKRSYH